jgi:hypothetical protein
LNGAVVRLAQVSKAQMIDGINSLQASPTVRQTMLRYNITN